MSPPTSHEWETLFDLITMIRSQKPGPSAPIPESTPPSLQLLCTQAYTRGKLAARDTSIQGPQISETDSDHQKLILTTYFSLGMEAGSEQSISSRKDQPMEGKKPDEFYGDRSKYKAFVTQLALTFGAEPNKFSTDKAKISFAASYLRGAAFDWLEPFINELNGEVVYDSYPSFLLGLKAAFADPDAYATAEKELEELNQTSSCSAYYSRFVALLAQLKWTEDAVKIHYFRKGLKDSIKDLLVGRDLPVTTNEFATLCIKLDNQIQARARERYGLRNSNPRFRTFPTDQPPLRLANQFPVSNTQQAQPPGDPMELDALSRKAYRKANNLCTYCGKGGHWVKNCPKARSRNQTLASVQVDSHQDIGLPSITNPPKNDEN